MSLYNKKDSFFYLSSESNIFLKKVQKNKPALCGIHRTGLSLSKFPRQIILYL